MKLSRRSWVLLGSASLLAAGGVKVLSARDEELIVALIRRKLGHVRIDRGDLERFASDFVAQGDSRMSVLRKVAAEFPDLVFGDGVRRRLPRGLADRLTLFERQLFASFLTSIGYFSANRPGPFRYSRLRDPYDSVCQSPFFRSR